MSIATAARFARRELRGGVSGFRIFLACLALGVAAIAAVGSVRSGIEAGLAREGAALLGGDAELDFTYRFANEAERAWMERVADRVSEIADFRSMAVVDRPEGVERGLTQIKAVDTLYPLIGSVVLKPNMPLADALADQNGRPGAVMERALIDRLGLTVGDRFRLGTQEFILTATLQRVPDSAAGGFGLGPRTIVLRSSLANAELLAPGTLFNSKYRLDLPPGTALALLEEQARAAFENTGMRWTDARNGAPGVSEFVDRLGAFLVLVGLSGLAVGGVGVSAAVRAYLSGKTSVIATLRTLGAERRMIFQTYFLQIGVLSLLGIAIGLALGALIPIALSPIIEAQLPIPAEFTLYPVPLAEAALYGLLTAFVFTLWPLARAEDVRAATLFRDALGGTQLLPAARYLVWIALGLIAPDRAGRGVFRHVAPNIVDRRWDRLCSWPARACRCGYPLAITPCRTPSQGPSRPALGARCNFRHARRGCIGCLVTWSGAFGAGSRWSDRRKPAQRHIWQPARYCPQLFLCRHSTRSDRRLYGKAA